MEKYYVIPVLDRLVYFLYQDIWNMHTSPESNVILRIMYTTEFEIILLLFIDAFLIQIIEWIRNDIAVAQKGDDFVTLKPFKINKTRYSEVCA